MNNRILGTIVGVAGTALAGAGIALLALEYRGIWAGPSVSWLSPVAGIVIAVVAFLSVTKVKGANG